VVEVVEQIDSTPVENGLTGEVVDLCDMLKGEANCNLDIANSTAGVANWSSQLQTSYFRDNQARLGLLPEALAQRVKQTYNLIEGENQLIRIYTDLWPRAPCIPKAVCS